MSESLCLSEVNVGESARILSFKNQQEASKMMTMGILPGEVVFVSRKTLAGRSLYLQSGNIRFALRQSEAKSIIVSKVSI